MKYHSLIVLLLCLLCKATAFSAPVYPRPITIVQPDGSELTIVGHGDEFQHYITTTDNYTIVKDNDGYYRYAKLSAGKLVPSEVVANNEGNRLTQERSFLKGLKPGILPQVSSRSKRLMNRSRSLERSVNNVSFYSKAPAMSEDYRGLVILVNFNDRTFDRGDIVAKYHYYDLMNKDGYNGYEDTYPFDRFQTCTGSLRDYFRDNSNGVFSPTFDVVGPVNINRSQYYINGVERSFDLVEEVLRSIDGEVDFSQYDSDGDGDVDMFYIIYAGYSSSYAGNDERYMWPHASTMVDFEDDSNNIYLDGKRMARFACSAEFFGWEEDGDKFLDGIGVICHEFSHVLGFADHYDTYGYQEHPNAWDVMSSGCYNGNFNDTPCAYNSYEKWEAGFVTPATLNDYADCEVSLRSTETSHEAFLLHTYQEHVSFFMENRQPDKWDKYLPGHGLLVWRVDSVRPEYWQQNIVNVTTRACFRLVRACGTQGSMLSGVEDTDFDPFPGTHGVTELTNVSSNANLLTYDMYMSPLVLTSISESDDGVISFMSETDPLADGEPMSYDLCRDMTVNAEKLEGDEWVPVSWRATAGYETVNGNEVDFVYELLPNTVGITPNGSDVSRGVRLQMTYRPDGSLAVSAQRVMLTEGYGIWFCNLTDFENNGTGGAIFTLDRHGVPSIDADVQLAWISQQPSAYMISKAKIIDNLAVYRNIKFSKTSASSGINGVSASQKPGVTGTYNTLGQRVSDDACGLVVKNGKITYVK